MKDRLEISPCGPLHASIRPPGSKSLTNRALVCAALARGPSRLLRTLDSEDTRHMLSGWQALGVDMTLDQTSHTTEVRGCDGRIPATQADLQLGNSGTTVRFLTAAVAAGHGTFRLDGVARMRERPIQDLLDALQQLGVDATSELGTGSPPVIVRARGLPGGTATVSGDISSQYLSGLLLVAPYAQQDVRLVIAGELVSRPYVEMTLAVMRSFSVTVDATEDGYRVPAGQSYLGCEYPIEPDASAASYFWAAAAIVGGSVTVEGLDRTALQGDVAFCDCLARMGCQVTEAAGHMTVTGGPLRGIDVDMNAMSDTVQTLAAVALFAEGPTRIRNVSHNRHKESDRIGDLATELRRLGAEVQEHDDGLTIVPQALRPATIHTYDDHRMAMSLALVGLKQPGIVILDPGCTSKTYPDFFRDLLRVCGNSVV